MEIDNEIASFIAKNREEDFSVRIYETPVIPGCKPLNRGTSESNVVAQEGVTEITKATKYQARSTQRVMTGMEQSRVISREYLERMEDMAAPADESRASAGGIASASNELATMAERQKKMMEQFTLR